MINVKSNRGGTERFAMNTTPKKQAVVVGFKGVRALIKCTVTLVQQRLSLVEAQS